MLGVGVVVVVVVVVVSAAGVITVVVAVVRFFVAYRGLCVCSLPWLFTAIGTVIVFGVVVAFVVGSCRFSLCECVAP